MYDLNNERMIACSKTYTKVTRELGEEYNVPPPQCEYGQARCESLMEYIRQIVTILATQAAQEATWRTLHVAAQNVPGDLYVQCTAITIESANVGRLIIPTFNSSAHV